MAFVAEQQLDKGDLQAAKKQLGLISEQARASNRTIDALLHMAKALQQEPERQEVDLDKLVRSAVNEATVSVASFSPGTSLPAIQVRPLGTAWTDESLLRIDLVNLITNALKFNLDRLQTTVTIERLERSSDGMSTGLNLVVRDNGVGFDAIDVGLALQPFKRLRATSEVPGYGIGLDIVRRITRRLQGHLDLISQPGRGTTVTLRLP